jgi:hypothetical protein
MPSRASIVRWPAAHDGRARRRRVRRGPPDAATPKRIGAAVVTSLRASAAFSARPSFTPFASSACTRSNGSSHQSLSSWTVVVIENLELVGEAAPGECGDEPVAHRLGERRRRSGDPLDLAVEVDVGRPPAALDDRAIRTRPRRHQRNGRDSNPRRRKPRPLSRRLHSSTLPPFRSRGYRATLRGSQERCQSGRMGRPAKALIVVMRSVGSNPTLSATRPARRHGAPVGRFSRRVHRRPE